MCGAKTGSDRAIRVQHVIDYGIAYTELYKLQRTYFWPSPSDGGVYSEIYSKVNGAEFF